MLLYAASVWANLEALRAVLSFIVPFIGLACAIFYRFENQEFRRQCPGCGRVVKLYDAVCMRCGEELEFPEIAVVPEAAVARRRA